MEMARGLFAVAGVLLLIVGCVGSKTDNANWFPDQKTVGRIEQIIRKMPPLSSGDLTAIPMDQYGRFYYALTQNGRKIVFGDFLAVYVVRVNGGRDITPGVHIEKQLKWVMTGGGCAHLNLWYDVQDDRVTEFH